ncbi:MAG: Uma2 family endonuclease [Gemmataceae bacterium]|nr:Uma2 family endonuclease [Gemmataceae bacterium]
MATASVLMPETASALTSQDECLYEIVNGQRVELPPMSAYASIITSILISKLNSFAELHSLGIAFAEVLLQLRGLNRNRRPDGAYVSYQRWPKGRPIPEDDNAWDVVPNLAIEVVSPNDPAEDLLEKIEEYFRAGVEQVWVVYPRRRMVHVYDSLTQIRGLTRSDALEGGSVLPGFKLPLASLFQEEATGP